MNNLIPYKFTFLWKNIEFYTTEFQHLEKAGAGFFAF